MYPNNTKIIIFYVLIAIHFLNLSLIDGGTALALQFDSFAPITNSNYAPFTISSCVKNALL